MEKDKQLIEHILMNSSAQRPPNEFTQNVVAAWKKELEHPVTIAPLISTRAWFFISTSVVALVAWAFGMDTGSSSSSPVYSVVSRFIEFTQFDIQVQPIMGISLVTMAVMTIISIAYLNKRRTFGNLSLF